MPAYIPTSEQVGLADYSNIGPNPADESSAPADSGGLVSTLIKKGYTQERASTLASTLIDNANNLPSTDNQPAPTAALPGRASTAAASVPATIPQTTMGGLLAAGSGVPIGNTEATTRQVQDNELVAKQMEGLLAGDSRYIRNARMKGAEFANARGQFGSSFAAGAAEGAAIDKALPIAVADAQGYRDVAAQNMNALNTMSLANLQRATTLDTALLSANTSTNLANLDAEIRVGVANLQAATQVNIANLDANTRTNIANLQAATSVQLQDMQSQLQLVMQGRQMSHDVGMEQFRQEGRVDLSLLDGAIREQLLQYEIQGRIDLSKLNHEQVLAVNEILDQYNRARQDDDQAFQRQTQHAAAALQAQNDYIAYMTAYADVDMDAAAAARLRQDAWNNLTAEMAMINGLYSEFPPIVAKQESPKPGAFSGLG